MSERDDMVTEIQSLRAERDLAQAKCVEMWNAMSKFVRLSTDNPCVRIQAEGLPDQIALGDAMQVIKQLLNVNNPGQAPLDRLAKAEARNERLERVRDKVQGFKRGGEAMKHTLNLVEKWRMSRAHTYSSENADHYNRGFDAGLFRCAEELKAALCADGVCPECGIVRPDDDRVKAGLKCGPCAYGGGNHEVARNPEQNFSDR